MHTIQAFITIQSNYPNKTQKQNHANSITGKPYTVLASDFPTETSLGCPYTKQVHIHK